MCRQAFFDAKKRQPLAKLTQNLFLYTVGTRAKSFQAFPHLRRKWVRPQAAYAFIAYPPSVFFQMAMRPAFAAPTAACSMQMPRSSGAYFL